MWIDYDVQRTARRCTATGRVFSPGEEFYSVLAPPADDLASDLIERHDFSREAWQGPPEEAIGWWRSRVPAASEKPKLAPNEVLLELFDRWADDAQRVESRYVLTLLLIRRRVLKLPSAEDVLPAVESPADEEVLAVYCPDRDAAYEVSVASPGEDRIGEIQAELFSLLYDGPSSPQSKQDVDGTTKRAA